MRRHSVLGMVALATAGLTLAACAGGSGSGSGSGAEGVTKTSITIGTTNPLTGAVASACKPVSDGALAWFDKVNSSGGVNGRKIKNVVMDDAYTAQEALANTRELAAKPVFAMFGGCGTIQPPAILPIVQKDSIPYLFPYAGLSQLTKANDVFLLLPLYGPQLDGLIAKEFKDHGAGSVFSIVQQTPEAKKTVSDIAASTKRLGGKMVGSAYTTAGESDQTPLVLKVKNAHPDYVVISESAPDAARIVTAMQSQNAFPKKFILGTSTLATGAFLNPAGSAANGKVLTVSPTLPASSDEAKSCVSALDAKQIKPEGFSLYGCAAAQAFTSAVKDMGPSPTRAALVKAFRSWSGKAASEVMPPLTFSGESNVGEESMVLLGVEDGQFVSQGTLAIKN